MSLLNQLTNELKTAMKAGDQRRLNALRMLVSALRYAQIDSPQIDEAGMQQVLAKEAKKRREAITAFREGGREEQAKEEEYELAMIEEYLPSMMSEEAVREKIVGIMKSEQGTGNYGEMMNRVMKELKGKAEGGVVSRIVKEVYTQSE